MSEQSSEVALCLSKAQQLIESGKQKQALRELWLAEAHARGDAEGIREVLGVVTAFGERVEPPRTLGAWQRRLGDYEITNLDHDRKFLERIRLTEERGFLLAELTAANPRGQTQRVLLKPLSDSEALVLGPLSDAGETLRVQSVNGEERLTTSGYQARRVGR